MVKSWDMINKVAFKECWVATERNDMHQADEEAHAFCMALKGNMWNFGGKYQLTSMATLGEVSEYCGWADVERAAMLKNDKILCKGARCLQYKKYSDGSLAGDSERISRDMKNYRTSKARVKKQG